MCNRRELPAHPKLQISNLVDLSTVAAIQNSNRSWVKIQSALWVKIQSALTSKQIVSSSFRVVNGFGWGVGSAVINGALEVIYENPKKYSEDQLIMKPFPQFETNKKKLPELWEEYRQRMIALAGVAIFMYGNKLDEKGEIIPANGVMREFEIAVQHGLLPIPIGATGYVAMKIFEEIEKDPKRYYGDNNEIFPLVKEIANAELDPSQVVKKVVHILSLLTK